jgi:uncharacterized repeat protein (TIGR01451 family)
LSAGNLSAAGTPAGTTITNSVTVNYSVGGVARAPITSAVSLRVDELISVRVTAPASAATVNSPDTNKALAFTVTNVGNGTESFTLRPDLAPAVVDQFNPTPGSAGQLFLDVNNNGILDAGDTLISAPITLNADQSARVLVVSNIPAALNNGDQGVVMLTAASTTPGAAPAPRGTILPNLGTPTVGGGTIDAVVGVGPGGAADSGSDNSAVGTYLVSAITVTIQKAVLSVTDPYGVTSGTCNVAMPPAGCSIFVPGTLIQYRLTVTIAGTGTGQNLQVTDSIPPNTTYVMNTIRYDAAARTDMVDGDNASCSGCGNAVGTVAVFIGDVAVTAGTPITHYIDYSIIIN